MSSEAKVVTAKRNLLRQPWFQRCSPFIIGGSSGMIATVCIQPLDMIKVRLQLYGEGTRGGTRPTPLSVVRDVVARGRLIDLYDGLSAGLLRQVVYGTARLGFFFSFEDALKKRAEKNNTTYGFGQRSLASLSAGGLGAFIGNPVEVALIRMQSDGLKPKAEQARYSSVFNALARIVRNESIRALFGGSYPTIVRAMSTNFGQLAFFSETKHQLQKRTNISEEGRSVVASAVGGLAASFFSLPFDLVKTRLQRQARGSNSGVQYTGVVDCIVRIAKEEGLLRFYRGFGTYCLRIAPHSVIALIIADYMKRSLT